MANCPKCGRELKIFDWKQHCPDCGANMFVYNQQERLMQEADIAEVQYYHFQKKIDRLKASFIGSKLAIARIITSLLPIGAVFLPLAKVKSYTLSDEIAGNFSLLDIINNIDKITGDDGIPALLGKEKTAGIVLMASVALFVLSVLAVVLHFVLNTLSCSPKGKIRNKIMDIIILATTFGAAVAFLAIPSNPTVKLGIGIGSILYIVLQIVNVVIDWLTMKEGIPVNHKQCFVGGIPIEEYFEMQEKGMSKEEIRAIQYERLQAIQDEIDAKLKEEEAKKAEAEKKGATVNG